tara:strand:+ start:153 stop:275 length:123 start_codon:yes stop_codon:yes gene_type:complete
VAVLQLTQTMEEQELQADLAVVVQHLVAQQVQVEQVILLQ